MLDEGVESACSSVATSSTLAAPFAIQASNANANVPRD
jgi:hypothetical protein